MQSLHLPSKKSEFKVKTFHRSISLFNRDHLVVKIYEAVVN